MSLTNRNSGTHFLTLSAYNRFRMFSSRRSDSSISDAESIQSSLAAEEQGSTGDCLPAQRTEGEILSPPNLKTVTFNEPSYTQGSSGDCLPTQRTEGEILLAPNLKAFTLNELISATRNFCPESLIGEEAFGYVFKGWIDELTFTPSKPGVGMVVAVKKFKPENFHGHNAWLTEFCYLGQLHHPNLVKVIGFCLDGDNRLLVYEFMPRGGLDNHLFGRGVQPLSWATRIKVAIGAAKGLAFLHDAKSQVIYQDVKSSNILLDSDFDAKLSGIGLARAGPTWDMTHVIQCGRGSGWVDELDLMILWMNRGIRFSDPSDLWNMTNVPTGVLGTLGYAAPEYIATGHLSAKADVYSFGVVLLELLSGRRAYDGSKSGAEQNIVDWARPYLGDKRKLFRIMDYKLEGQFPKKVAYAMANLVSVCIDKDPKLRPRMSKVLAVLEKFQDTNTAEKLVQTEQAKSLRYRKKSPMRHNASPLCSTPDTSPHRPTSGRKLLPSNR